MARRTRRAAHAAEVVAGRPLLLGVLVLALGAFLLIVGFLATTGPPFQEKYRLTVSVPGDNPTLRPGQAVRVGGRLAGLVSEVEPDRERGGATVVANITKPGFRPLPDDTKAYVRVHSIVYETYLELRPGESRTALEDGDRLRAEASSGVDLLEAVQLFDAKSRRDLRRTAVGVGYGVADRGRELNGALADTPELASDMASQLNAATREEGALGRIVAGAARTARGARGTRGDDVAAAIGSADATLSAVARRRAELRDALRRLPGDAGQLPRGRAAGRAHARRPRRAGRRPPPGRAVAHRDAPRRSTALLTKGEILRSDVDKIADVADPVIRGARPAVFDLFGTMTALGPLNRHLKTLLTRIGPYRREYRIPGEPGVRKGSGEIAEAGRRFIDATDDPLDAGLAPGAPSWRVMPVVTARPCQNPFPKPGEADKDTIVDGQCRKGGGP